MKTYDHKCTIETVKGWFTDPDIAGDKAPHAATIVTQDKKVVVIRWGRPNSGFYSIYYTLFGNVLMVCGDLGEAVYQWSEEITLKFLSGLHIDYFASKCQASPHGRGFLDWDAEACEAEIAGYFEEGERRDEALKSLIYRVKNAQADKKSWSIYHRGNWIDVLKIDLAAFAEEELHKVVLPLFDALIYETKRYCGSQSEWIQFLFSEEGYWLFGEDVGELADMGQIIENRCYAHLEGLRMVYDQFKDSDDQFQNKRKIS